MPGTTILEKKRPAGTGSAGPTPPAVLHWAYSFVLRRMPMMAMPAATQASMARTTPITATPVLARFSRQAFQSVQVGFDRSVLAQDPVADLDREFDSYEQFKREPYAYIVHWNTRRRQIRLEGHIPKEFRNMSLTV